MRKKLSSIIIMVLIVVALVVTLVACVEPVKPKEEKETMDQRTAIDTIMSAHGYGDSTVLNMNFSIDTTVNNELYRVKIGANLNKKQSQLLFEVKDANEKMIVGLYINEGKVFIHSGENKPKLYLADFDVSDIIQAALEADLIAELDKILAGMDMDFDGILDLAAPILFSPAELVVDEATGNTTYSMNVEYKALMEVLMMTMDTMNLNQLLDGMGINIDIDLNKLILGIEFPEDLSLKLVSVIDANGVAQSTEVLVNVAEASIFNIKFQSNVSSSNQDIGLPDDINDYVAFSLTNICFDSVLNINSDKLDVADLVNMITGEKTLPTGVIVFNSNTDFSIKVRLDLDVDDNNKNLIFIEVYSGKEFNNKLIGIYFKEGTLYLDYSSVLPNGTKLPNMMVKNIDISAKLREIVALITGTIAEQAPTEDGILAVTNTTDGTPTLAPDLVAFANSALGLLGMNNNVSISGDKISITIDQNLFDSLKTIVSSLDVTYPEFMGPVKVDINLDPTKGINDIDITTRLDGYNTDLALNLNNFNLGYINSTIAKSIDDQIGDKAFIESVNEILFRAVEGMHLGGEIRLKLAAGKYNLSEIFSIFDITFPELFYDLEYDLDEKFNIDLKLNLDRTNKDNNQMSLEIIAQRDNFLCKAGEVLIGLYHQDNKLYLDASNIGVANMKLPEVMINIDFLTMLTDELNKLDNGSLLPLVSEPISIPQENRSVLSNVNDIIELQVNAEKLAVLATSTAIANVLKSLDVDITLPEFEVKGEFMGFDNITIALTSGDLGVDLGINKTIVGVKQDIPRHEIADNSEYVDLLTAFVDKFVSVDIDTTIDISSTEGKLDITNLINGILNATGSTLAVPIELDMTNYNSIMNLKVQWEIDQANYNNTQLKLELTSGDHIFLGFYLFGGEGYVNIPALDAKIEIRGMYLQKNMNDALANLQRDVSLNLTHIIEDLLAGKDITLKPRDTETSAMADELQIPAEFIEYLFKGISIENTTVGLNYTADLMRAMLLTVGVDLGVSSTLDVVLDIPNGIINLAGTIGNLSLGVDVEVLSIGEPITIDMNSEMFADYKVIDTVNGLTITNNLFDAMSAVLNGTLVNNNIENSIMQTDLSFENIKENKTVFGVNMVPGDMLLQIKNSAVKENGKTMIYVFITDAGLHIKGTKDWFDHSLLGIDVSGQLVDVPIAMDVKGMLSTMFDDLLTVIRPVENAGDENVGGGDTGSSDASTNDTATTPGIDSLLKAVNVYLMPTDQMRVSIEIDAEKFNPFITTTLNDMLHGIDAAAAGMPSSVDFTKVNYDSVNPGVFINGLFDHVIWPYILSMNSSANLLKNQLKGSMIKTLNRIFPFPHITEGFINLNLDQNKLSSVEINLRDKIKGDYWELDLVSAAAEGTIDWGSDGVIVDDDGSGNKWYQLTNKPQSLHVEFNPYGTKSLMSYFNKYARKVVNSRYAFSDISWDFVGSGIFGAGFVAGGDPATAVAIPGSYTVLGTAKFGDVIETIAVKVDVRGGDQVVGVKPITLSPYATLPTTVELMLADGTTKVIKNVNILEGAPTDYKAHTVTGRIKYGTEVNSETGETVDKYYNVDINYLDATIKTISSGSEFTMTLEQFGRGEFNGFTTSTVQIQYAFGGHAIINATYDYSDLTRTIDDKGGVRYIYMILGAGTGAEQRAPITINVTPKVIEDITLNAKTDNRLEIDPYDIMEKGINAYPSEVKVNYVDGTSEMLAVTWNVDNITNTYLGSTGTAKAIYTLGNYVWTQDVQVVMARREALGFKFENGNNYISVNTMYWQQQGHSYYFKDTATVVFENGDNRVLPITWEGLDKIDNIGVTSGTLFVTAVIGNGDFAQRVQVKVVGQPIGPNAVVDTYVIDPLEVLYRGKQAFSDTLKIKLDDGSFAVLPVEWSADNVNITLDGGDFDVTVNVGSVELPVSVKVLYRADWKLKSETFNIDPFDFLSNSGIGFYPSELEFESQGETIKFNVRWNLDSVNVTLDGGLYAASVDVFNGDNLKRFSININVHKREVKSFEIDRLTENVISIAMGTELPKTATVTFGDDSTKVVNVTYKNVDVNTAGEHNATVVFFEYKGTSLTEDITVNVLDRSVKTFVLEGLDADTNTVTIVTGTELPKTATVTFGDDSTKVVNVTYENVDINKAGAYTATVSYLVDDVAIQQTVEINVRVYDHIIKDFAIEGMVDGAMSIKANTILPSTANVTFSDGTTGTLNISFTNIYLDVYGQQNGKVVFYSNDINNRQEFEVTITVYDRTIVSYTIDGLTDNSIRVTVGGTLPSRANVVYKDGTSATIDVIYTGVEYDSFGTYQAQAVFFDGVEGETRQAFDIEVVVFDRTVTNVAIEGLGEDNLLNVAINGTLPATATVTFADGTTEVVNITYSIDTTIAGLQENVTVTVFDGMGDDSQHTITISVFVADRTVDTYTINGVENNEIRINSESELPTTANVVFKDGTTQNDVAITFTGIDYTKAGSQAGKVVFTLSETETQERDITIFVIDRTVVDYALNIDGMADVSIVDGVLNIKKGTTVLPTTANVTFKDTDELVNVAITITVDTATGGSKTGTITFTVDGVEQTQDITVFVVDRTVDTYTINGVTDNKINVKVNDTLTGLTAKVTFADGNTLDNVAIIFTGIDTSTFGEKTGKIVFFDGVANETRQEFDITVTVYDNTVSKVEIEGLDAKNTINIALNGTLPTTATVTHNDGTVEDVTISINADTSVAGAHSSISITIYAGADNEHTFTINVFVIDRNIKEYTIITDGVADVNMVDGVLNIKKGTTELPTTANVTLNDTTVLSNVAITITVDTTIGGTISGTIVFTLSETESQELPISVFVIDRTVAEYTINGVTDNKISVKVGNDLSGLTAKVTFADGNTLDNVAITFANIDTSAFGDKTGKIVFFDGVDGETRQELDITVTVYDNTVKSVMIGEVAAGGTINIALNGTLPTEATVTHNDGTVETVTISINADTAVAGAHSNISITIYAGADNEHTFTISVFVIDRTVDTYTINVDGIADVSMVGEVLNIKKGTTVLPTTANVVLKDGTQLTDVAIVINVDTATGGSKTGTIVFTVDEAAQTLDITAFVTDRTVTTVEITGYDASASRLTINKGDTLPATAKVTLADGTVLENVAITYSNETVVSGSNLGIVLTINDGSIMDAAHVLTIEIFVIDRTVVSFAIEGMDAETKTINLTVGEALPVNATVTFADGSEEIVAITYKNAELISTVGTHTINIVLFEGASNSHESTITVVVAADVA